MLYEEKRLNKTKRVHILELEIPKTITVNYRTAGKVVEMREDHFSKNNAKLTLTKRHEWNKSYEYKHSLTTRICTHGVESTSHCDSKPSSIRVSGGCPNAFESPHDRLGL